MRKQQPTADQIREFIDGLRERLHGALRDGRALSIDVRAGLLPSNGPVFEGWVADGRLTVVVHIGGGVDEHDPTMVAAK